MRIPRRSHSTYPEHFDPRRVPPSTTRRERAQVRSPLPMPRGLEGAREASVMPHVSAL